MGQSSHIISRTILTGQRALRGCREINAISPSIGLEDYIMPKRQKRAGSVMSMVSCLESNVARQADLEDIVLGILELLRLVEPTSGWAHG
jgi:hypothetical protein